MWIIRNRLVPGRQFAAVNILGILFVKRDVTISPVLVNHERIHTAQMIELLVVFFYLWYAVEWFLRYLKEGDWMRAYYKIGFEREAYVNENNMSYLQKRRLFAFCKWIR